MSATPEIETRAEQPYVAISARVPMSGLAGVGARLGQVFGWLGARGVAPAGPPFFKYNVIDMAGDLEVEGGVPIAQAMEGDTQVLSGVLPAGRDLNPRGLSANKIAPGCSRHVLDRHSRVVRPSRAAQACGRRSLRSLRATHRSTYGQRDQFRPFPLDRRTS